MRSSRVLVTGGAGFIGSSLVEFLLKKNNYVTVLDNFTSGNKLQKIKSKNLEIVEGDCSLTSVLRELSSKFEVIFHLAADPEIRLPATKPKSIFKNNIKATNVLLEWVKDTSAHTIVLTSSSTVYGEAKIIPTPESQPCEPISLYGGSKLACEALLSAYCHIYKKKGIVLRFANVIGPRSTHGIISDMLTKLKKNSTKLEILGDGNQNKSYLYIDDCISGIIQVLNKSKSIFDVYNLGSNTQITVRRIIDLILNEYGNENVKKIFTGGVEGGGGWIGDVKNMFLDIEKIKQLGWKPKLNSEEAIKRTIKELNYK